MAHLVAPRAVADLDDIWIYVARESGSIDLANHFVDSITEHFYALARFPYLGRMREEDLGPGHRSLAVGEYVIVYCVENENALILRANGAWKGCSAHEEGRAAVQALKRF